MRSITYRTIAGTSVVLAFFIVLVGISVSYSVHQRAETARFDRLQGLIYGILGATEIDNSARLHVDEFALPDPQLRVATIGTYAEILGFDQSRLWQSTSLTSWIPRVDIRPIGDWHFESLSNESGQSVHRLQLSTAWEFENGEEMPFTVHVVSEADSLSRQLSRFDRSLWVTLLGSAILLLLVQLSVLKKSLQPLRDISAEVRQIEQGERSSISNHFGKELQPIADGLNALISSERQRQSQYRHLIDDLAHSLKTPISVLKNLQDAENSVISEQSQLMQLTIERHLQRANMTGASSYLASPISVNPILLRIVASLSKIYKEPAIDFDTQVEESFTVRMDEADLYEVLGNLLENACKYGASYISVRSDCERKTLEISDNGRGFPNIDLNQLIPRGVRADSQSEGTGFGLAAASELMNYYGGTLKPMHGEHGGATIQLHFRI